MDNNENKRNRKWKYEENYHSCAQTKRTDMK